MTPHPPQDIATVLAAMLTCGLLGAIGQGIRAVLGLKKANTVDATGPQAQFNAAYFGISLMIGFIAGVVAGIVLGLKNFISINLDDIKPFLGIIASGYAGADFIESSLSLVLPGSAPKAVSQVPESPAPSSQSPASPSVAAPVPSGDDLFRAALAIVAPKVNAATWLPPLTAAFAKFDVNTDRRKAVAVGQFLVEAGAGFNEIKENLNYTHADRLVQVYPSYFKTVQDAQPYCGNPEKLGNHVYANRLGNGDEATGDGFRFRGRGLIQLTGRAEYAEFGATIGKSAEDTAAYCETPEGAAMSGCWYLSSRGCLPLADQWQISMVTKKVNGAAMLGNQQRIDYAKDMLKHLGGQVPS